MFRKLHKTIIFCFILTVIASLCFAESGDIAITVLHTNDMHGRVMSKNGGLARIATLVKQVRADMPNVLLLDAGDIIHGTPVEYLSGGKAIISSMNATGYDCATLGNHEFDFGLDITKQAISLAKFPFVCANIQASSGGLWDNVEPYRIFNVDGVKICVLGLTTLETVSLHWPDSIKDITVADPIETAKKLVPQLRKQADVIIILSHLGYNVDRKLAKKVKGIDFIVGGHSHTLLENWIWVGNTLITQAGARSAALGRIDFMVHRDDKSCRIISINGKGKLWNRLKNPPLGKKYPEKAIIPVTNDIPEDNAVEHAYLPYKNDTKAKLDEILCTANSAIFGGNGESPASDLVAEAVRKSAKSDVAIINCDSISKDGLQAGILTLKSVFDLIDGYTGQEIITVQMSGKDFLNALSTYHSKRSSVLATAGAEVDANKSKGTLSQPQITINNHPIDLYHNYSVAAQAYVVMDIMQKIPSIKVLNESHITTREALVEYFKSHKELAATAFSKGEISNQK